ncbi:MAG: DUF2723 domain-containing protein [Kiritimatiellae bacterium]|nr:DUF2723 domain-containing protein [Kiritimatiellia bacterium]
MKFTARRISRWLIPAFFALYALTAQRGVAWQDCGLYQLRIAYRDLAGFFGAATAHPAYIRLAYAFSFLSGAFFNVEVPAAANVFSSLCMALAVGVLFLVAHEISGSRRGALLASLTFGFAHCTWWLATIAESYPLSVFLIGLEALLAIRIVKTGATAYRALVLGACSGLGFATHNLSILSLPFVFAALVASCRNRLGRGAPGAVLAPILFAASWFAFSDIRGRIALSGAATPVAIATDILFGNYAREVSGASGAPFKVTIANFVLMAFSLALPCWAAGAAAIRRLCRRAPIQLPRSKPVRLVLALFAIHFLFLIRYRIADQALFMLPTLFFACALLSCLLRKTAMPILLAASTALCAIAVPLAANALLHRTPLQRRIVASRARILPFRDEIRYWILPWKHDEYSAELFAAAAIDAMNRRPGAMLFADTTSAPPVALRISSADTAWRFFTPWSDLSRFAADATAGQPAFAVSAIPGYCPAKPLAAGAVQTLPIEITAAKR